MTSETTPARDLTVEDINAINELLNRAAPSPSVDGTAAHEERQRIADLQWKLVAIGHAIERKWSETTPAPEVARRLIVIRERHYGEFDADVLFLLDLVASTASQLAAAQKSTVSDSERRLLDALKGSKSPCGHWSQYALTEDGGKHIVCLQCQLAAAEQRAEQAEARATALEQDNEASKFDFLKMLQAERNEKEEAYQALRRAALAPGVGESFKACIERSVEHIRQGREDYERLRVITAQHETLKTAATAAHHEMCHATATRNSFTDALDLLDAALFPPRSPMPATEPQP